MSDDPETHEDPTPPEDEPIIMTQPGLSPEDHIIHEAPAWLAKPVEGDEEEDADNE